MNLLRRIRTSTISSLDVLTLCVSLMLLAMLAAAPPAYSASKNLAKKRSAQKKKPVKENCKVRFIKQGNAASSIFISFQADSKEDCANMSDDNTTITYSGK